MKLAHGTYARIARELGCSASLVEKVAHGKRRNALVEIELEKAYREQQSRARKLQRLRRINKKK